MVGIVVTTSPICFNQHVISVQFLVMKLIPSDHHHTFKRYRSVVFPALSYITQTSKVSPGVHPLSRLPLMVQRTSPRIRIRISFFAQSKFHILDKEAPILNVFGMWGKEREGASRKESGVLEDQILNRRDVAESQRLGRWIELPRRGLRVDHDSPLAGLIGL